MTGYFQNVRTYKNEEAKLKSLLFDGTGQLRTQKAFQLCERFAKAEKMEFYNYLEEGDMLKNIAIETTDKMSMNELHAYVNKKFQNQIS